VVAQQRDGLRGVAAGAVQETTSRRGRVDRRYVQQGAVHEGCRPVREQYASPRRARPRVRATGTGTDACSRPFDMAVASLVLRHRRLRRVARRAWSVFGIVAVPAGGVSPSRFEHVFA
jgi:hypothetical protein